MDIVRVEYDLCIRYEDVISGVVHRENGPAVEWKNGTKYWCINGQLHREDGPAIEFNNGDKQWWLYGYQYSKEDYDKKIIEMKLKRILDL